MNIRLADLSDRTRATARKIDRLLRLADAPLRSRCARDEPAPEAGAPQADREGKTLTEWMSAAVDHDGRIE